MDDIKTIRQTILDRDYEGVVTELTNNIVNSMFEEFADETACDVPADQALADIFGLEMDYIMDGELLTYYNGKGSIV